MSKSSALRLSTLTAGLLLAGCSGSSTPASTPASTPTPQAAASTHLKTPWDGMLKAEAKAKNVQKIVNDQAKRQQQAIDKQTQ